MKTKTPKAKQGAKLQRRKPLRAARGSEATDKRLITAVTGLMEIVEGVRGSTWGCDGRRLVDTPEWCELYCAWNAEKRKPLNNALSETHEKKPQL